jgi:predicted N-acetyltransferase YhbS
VTGAVKVDHVVDPPLTGELKDALVELWADVAAAGGSVGVALPVDVAAVWALASTAFGRCERGEDHMLVAMSGPDPVGLVFLEQRPGPLFAHWATVKRLQVRPTLQNKGIGGRLLTAAHSYARAAGLEQLHLTVRGGTGTETFYERHGYRVVARIPEVIRLSACDDRDEIYMVARL